MLSAPIWLTKLKAADLHKLAVLIGTPCSGTKAAQIHSIQDALASLPRFKNDGKLRETASHNKISLVSIDMGIRNLAYSHWTATLLPPAYGLPAQYTRLALQAWRRINVSSQLSVQSGVSGLKTTSNTDASDQAAKEPVTPRESFEPIDYANRAYDFVKNMLNEHHPTHVLIERQRFRSGGNSAVQEWTIRVGVFEGMLYAVLKSLAEERTEYGKLFVEPMLPARVNRYWLEGRHVKCEDPVKVSTSKKTAREVKQTKIELVKKLLRAVNASVKDGQFTTSSDVIDMVSAFIEKKPVTSNKPINRRSNANCSKQTTVDGSKLDDLADCFLQGLAWVHWQNNRLKLKACKDEAYALME